MSLQRIQTWNWKGPVILIVFVASTLITQGVQSQNLKCISCIDRGDNGCANGSATTVTCDLEHNACIEAVTSVETSHDQFTCIVKGCSYGDSGRFDKALDFNGITMFTQINQCNKSLCNDNLAKENFQLIPPDGGRQQNEVQCYSCIGKTKDQCLVSNSPVKNCFNNYESCFDGNASISIGNATTIIPIKSCSQRDFCPRKTVTLGGATFGIEGACCKGNECNKNLSNKTQYQDGPPLVLFSDLNEETTTADTPQQLTTAHTFTNFTDKPQWPAPGGPIETYREGGMEVNTTMVYVLDGHVSQNNTNNAVRLPTNLWLILFVVFMC
ncbi:ly6/PLAUR domain-containing protein 3 [Discoglossus pictus]